MLDLVLDTIEELSFPKEADDQTRLETPEFSHVASVEEVRRLSYVKPDNVVTIDSSEIKSIAKLIDKNTSTLNDKLLKRLVPLLLSYNASTAYVKAVLEEGFKIEVKFDNGLDESIQYVSYLAVLTHFVKNSGMPVSLKKQYLKKVAEGMADETIKALIKGIQSTQKHNELQAVIMNRSRPQDKPKTFSMKDAGSVVRTRK